MTAFKNSFVKIDHMEKPLIFHFSKSIKKLLEDKFIYCKAQMNSGSFFSEGKPLIITNFTFF